MASNSKALFFFALLSFSAVSLRPAFADNEEDPGLVMNFYKDACPQAEDIIKEQVRLLYKRHKNTAFSWLRNIFHDCGVQSCDASLLLDSTRRTLSEKETDRSFGLRNFRYIDNIKEAVERECPGVVSCSDILVLSARDGIVAFASFSASMELNDDMAAHDSLPQRKLEKRKLTEDSCQEEAQLLEGQLLELSEDLIHEMGKRLINYADYVRFRSTCKPLKSMLPKTPNHQLSQVPWLMLPRENVSETRISFLNPLENKKYSLDIPELRGKLFRGSSHGWILAVDGHPELFLINPFTRAQIQLPPLDTFPNVLRYDPDDEDEEYLIVRERTQSIYSQSVDYFRKAYLHKVVLSSSPTSNEYIAMAIYGYFTYLAFCKSGDKKWTQVQPVQNYEDVISHDGKFYALAVGGSIWVGDATSLPKMMRFEPSFRLQLEYKRSFVRMTSGELVIVGRLLEWKRIGWKRYLITTHCRIFKLDQRRLKWSKVISIGDDAFFIGRNNSLSISSQNLPSGWSKNCIYFTDDFTEGGLHEDGIDNGMYDLKNRRIEAMPGYVSDSVAVWPGPIWVVPNPCP